MTYWNEKGKYQKAYDYFYKKLVPSSGKASNKWGEMLRVLSNVYYRRHNDGDDYDDFLENRGESQGFFQNNKNMPEVQRKKVESLLNKFWDYDNKLEEAVNYVLKELMLHMSKDNKIWNPETNRLVNIDSRTGLRALKLLGCKLKYTCE